MLHNFKNSLQYERTQAARADLFYKTQLGAENIVRYNNDTVSDMEWQQQDIDVSITIKGKIYHVSEKFRNRSWNDLLIEIYSKYPNKLGWVHNGKSDLIVYFFPQEVYLLRESDFKTFCSKLFAAISPQIIKEFYKSKQTQQNIGIRLSKFRQVKLIAAFNPTYTTISVAVGLDVLKENEVQYCKKLFD